MIGRSRPNELSFGQDTLRDGSGGQVTRIAQKKRSKKGNFVVRLKLGPNFFDGEGKPVTLNASNGETHLIDKILYKSKEILNVIGIWKKTSKLPCG